MLGTWSRMVAGARSCTGPPVSQEGPQVRVRAPPPCASGGPGPASTAESRGQLLIMALNLQEEGQLHLGLFREAGK